VVCPVKVAVAKDYEAKGGARLGMGKFKNRETSPGASSVLRKRKG